MIKHRVFAFLKQSCIVWFISAGLKKPKKRRRTLPSPHRIF